MSDERTDKSSLEKDKEILAHLASPTFIPPFLPAPSISVVAPPARYISLSSHILIFDNQSPSTKTIKIINTCPNRICWRVLSNAPTRYVVNPNKGFLTHSEGIEIQVILVDGNKYNRRHQFIVQGKLAIPGENNRKTTWHNVTAVVQSLRVTTSKSKSDAAKSPGKERKSTEADRTHSSASSSSVTSSDGSSYASSASGSLSVPNQSSSEASVSIKVLDEKEFKEKQDDLIAQIRKAIEDKESSTQRMVRVVNEVKQLEVELDRAGQTAHQFTQKNIATEKAIVELKEKAKRVKEELETLREANK